MRRAELDAIIPLEVHRILEVWADWMRSGTVTRGLPTRSAGFDSGGINCFDDLEQSVDKATAHMADAVMSDLRALPDPRYWLSLTNRYLGDTARFRGIEADILAEACRLFLMGWSRKGGVV